MLWWSWGTWPDVLVDNGRKLYIAWQLAEGKVLYRDIAFLHGPLSPYLNSVLFRLFGVGLRTLVIFNIAVATALIGMLYYVLLQISNRAGATFACLVFVTVFAFGQLAPYGNYNYVCPYSYGLTHGAVLSVLALLCLLLYHKRGNLCFVASSGFATGLVGLAKAEVFLGLACALAAGLVLTILAQRPSGRRVLALLGSFFGFAAIPPVVAFVLFCLAMPPEQAARGILAGWRTALGGQVSALRFYRRGMGTLDTAGSVRVLLEWSARYLVIILPALVLALALRKPGRHRTWLAIVAFAAVAGCVGWIELPWPDAARPLPVVMAVLGVSSFISLVRRRRDPQACSQFIVRLTMTVFALVLLGKMILYARVYHYGFVLAMPATLLAVVTSVSWLPGALTRRGGYGAIVRASALGFLAGAVFVHLRYVDACISNKVHTVASGKDAFLADERGVFVNRMLDVISRRVPPDATLVAFPEGAMINFLARRVNPTPHSLFMPTEVAAFGEDDMLASLEAHSPDYLLLVHKDTSEFGYRFFGRDYARRIFNWAYRRYRPIERIGAWPLRDERFGLLLLERAASAQRKTADPA